MVNPRLALRRAARDISRAEVLCVSVHLHRPRRLRAEPGLSACRTFPEVWGRAPKGPSTPWNIPLESPLRFGPGVGGLMGLGWGIGGHVIS